MRVPCGRSAYRGGWPRTGPETLFLCNIPEGKDPIQQTLRFGEHVWFQRELWDGAERTSSSDAPSAAASSSPSTRPACRTSESIIDLEYDADDPNGSDDNGTPNGRTRKTRRRARAWGQREEDGSDGSPLPRGEQAWSVRMLVREVLRARFFKAKGLGGASAVSIKPAGTSKIFRREAAALAAS